MLAGFATAVPKTAEGTVEMIRQLKVAHDTAGKDRSAAMVTLKTMLVHAPELLRQETPGRHRSCSPGTSPRSAHGASRHLRTAFATPSSHWPAAWQNLDDEAKELSAMINDLVMSNANSVNQLGGPFVYGGVSGGLVLVKLGVGVFGGKSCAPPFEGHAGISQTWTQASAVFGY